METKENESLEDSVTLMLAILNNIGKKFGKRFSTERRTAPYGFYIVTGEDSDDYDWRGEFTTVEMIEELTEQIRRYTNTPRLYT